MANDKTEKTVLQQLYEDKVLCSKVDALLDEGKSIAFIREFCEAKNFSISAGSLNNYRKKREESIRKGIDLGAIIDKRANKGEVIELHKKEASVVEEGDMESRYAPDDSKIVSNLQVLEEIIAKGHNAIRTVDVIDPALALKAIDMHSKITGGAGGGITLHGVQELRLQQKALESAMATVILEFIPAEKQPEVWKRIDECEREFYDNMDISAEERQMRKTLKEMGVI